MYIIKKFRHDSFDQISHWIIVFICIYCLYMDLHNEVSVDSLSITSSSCGTSNTTSLKRRLSYNVENEVNNQSSSTHKSSMTSEAMLWNSMIETEANRLRQEILLDSDFDCPKSKFKESVESKKSTPPSSIIDRCSVKTTSDSDPVGVTFEDKSTQVSNEDQWISDCEDFSLINTLDYSPASNENYLITRSGNMYFFTLPYAI